jgi:DNA-binding transcriptional LysR family regulator
VNDNWRFTENQKNFTVKVPSVWQSNSGTSLVSACLSGLGIAYLPETTLQENIRSGELVPVLSKYSARGIPTWLVYPSKRFVPRRVRSALDFLVEDLS